MHTERETRENGNDNTSCTHLLLIIIVFCTIKRERRNVTSLSVEPFNGQIKTAEQRTTMQQYGDWYIGR